LEQILARFVGKKGLWIITRDSDYGTIYENRGFLNQLLYEELRKVSPGAEAFLINDVASGIRHFADITGVKADKLPTEKEAAEINKEIEALPPLGWLSSNGPDDTMMLFRNRQMAAVARAVVGDIAGSIPLPLIAAVAKASAGDISSTPPGGDPTETPK